MTTLNNIELRVLIKGKPITVYGHNGKNFVEGRAGSKFEIEVFNRNPFRVEAIISVDGLSVIDGKSAGVGSAGYLIEANSSVRIPGWKVSDAVAASFEFTGKDGSYATGQTGSSTNNGVIGVMAYKDRNYRAPVYNAQPPISMGHLGWGQPSYGWNTSGGEIRASLAGSKRMASASGTKMAKGGIATLASTSLTASASNTMSYSDAADSAYAAATETVALNNLGTGFGEATGFKTETVQFDRGDLQAMFAVYYDNARGLKARGIEVGRPSRVRHTATEPQAFPAMNCPVPSGWKG